MRASKSATILGSPRGRYNIHPERSPTFASHMLHGGTPDNWLDGRCSACAKGRAHSSREAAVQAKQLREDLFYRLNVFTLELPALRERGRDVILLARSLGDEISLRYDYPPIELGAAAQARLLSYAWPGNVRELRNVMEKAVILSEGGSIPPDLLPTGTETSAGEVAPSRPAGAGVEPAAEEGESFAEAKARLIEAWEIRYLRELLIRTGGNLGRACREGQLDKRNLQRKIKRYGIDLAGIRANSE